VCGDGARLPLADDCFDVVVSFETIEHLEDHEAFLAECRRVLKDEGVLVCSTPNKRIFSPVADSPPNAYHVREFWPDEFRLLLSGYFEDVALHGQCDVTLADNSVERDRGVHAFVDDDEVSSGYVVAVARKRRGEQV
jgi:SAM-dependent methyltransferase